MSKKQTVRRGRPAVYTGETEKKIVSLFKDGNNATQVRNILNSKNGTVGVSKADKANAKVRKDLGFEKPLGISMPTLLKIAHRNKIELTQGRPAVAA